MRQTNGAFPMIRRALALALAVSGAALATQPAQAQVFFDYYAGPIRPAPPPYPPPYYYPAPPAYPGAQPFLSPRDIVEAVRDQGFEPTSRPTRNRNVYALDARDPAGRPVRLIVEAFDGEIVQAIPVATQRRPDFAPADPGEPRVIPAPVAPRRPAAKPQAQKPAPGASSPASDALKMEPPATPPPPAPSVGAAPAKPAPAKPAPDKPAPDKPVPVAPLDAPPVAPSAPGVPVAPLE